MISGRLVQLIESNGEQIVDRLVAQFRHDPDLSHIHSLLDHEVRQWGQELLTHLGYWLSNNNEQQLTPRYEKLGKYCYEHQIPIHEAVRGLCRLRRKMLAFADENMVSNSSIELYAEEELERRLGRFFDNLIVHLVTGFEQAVPKPAGKPAGKTARALVH